MKLVLTERSVAHLLSAAGELRGIGDWRPEKGGPYGRFETVNDDDPRWTALVKTQGRKAQQTAFDKPAYYDEDTEELLVWFAQAVREREMGEQLSGWKLEPKGGYKKIIQERGNGDYVGPEA